MNNNTTHSLNDYFDDLFVNLQDTAIDFLRPSLFYIRIDQGIDYHILKRQIKVSPKRIGCVIARNNNEMVVIYLYI